MIPNSNPYNSQQPDGRQFASPLRSNANAQLGGSKHKGLNVIMSQNHQNAVNAYGMPGNATPSGTIPTYGRDAANPGNKS